YVMDCGHNSAKDQSRWSPGVNVGKPIELSDMCILIKHREQWLLWDTGYPDAVADRPVDTPVGPATRATDPSSREGLQPPIRRPLCGVLALAGDIRPQRVIAADLLYEELGAGGVHLVAEASNPIRMHRASSATRFTPNDDPRNWCCPTLSRGQHQPRRDID